MVTFLSEPQKEDVPHDKMDGIGDGL